MTAPMQSDITPVSLIETSVRCPGELFNVIQLMLPRFEKQMIYAPPPPVKWGSPVPNLFQRLATLCQAISERHDLYSRNAQACLFFWWMCDNHAGTKELLLNCEPPGSRWRNPGELERIRRFAHMHILGIKNATIIPETVQRHAMRFHLALYEVVMCDATVSGWLLDSDTQHRDEKIEKDSKSAGVSRPVPPSSCLTVQYLPGVCRGRAKKPAKSAATKVKAASSRRTTATATPMHKPDAVTETPATHDNERGIDDPEAWDFYNMFVIDGKAYPIAD